MLEPGSPSPPLLVCVCPTPCSLSLSLTLPLSSLSHPHCLCGSPLVLRAPCLSLAPHRPSTRSLHPHSPPDTLRGLSPSCHSRAQGQGACALDTAMTQHPALRPEQQSESPAEGRGRWTAEGAAWNAEARTGDRRGERGRRSETERQRERETAREGQGRTQTQGRREGGKRRRKEKERDR